MKQVIFRCGAVLALTTLVAGCTMKKQEAPDLSGPSEFGTSITVALSPDILVQDGSSQSVVTVTARGPNGAPLPNLALRADMYVDGVRADFGSLSTRNPVTGSNGRATLMYSAPMSVPGVGSSVIVEIGITPVGTDYNSARTQFASLRLIPPGTVLPPSGLVPAFTFAPTAPTANQTVLFDASTSQAPGTNPIVSYSWDFGDGRTAAGRTATHQYSSAGTYAVRLTITDGMGRSASASQSVTVTAGAIPTASFVFSPTTPSVNQAVNFNAAASVAAPGRQIVSYSWNMGDGSAAKSGAVVSHTFTQAATFVVTLTVTDDAGRTAVVSKDVAIAP